MDGDIVVVNSWNRLFMVIKFVVIFGVGDKCGWCSCNCCCDAIEETRKP